MGQLMGFAVLAWPITLLMAFLLVFVVVVSIVLYATRNKKSGWKWGWGAALLVYLAVFWDHIPTVVAHRYYCEKEAGFWVYKTLDQWKAENPGVLETLVANKGAPSTRKGDAQNFTDTYFLNQRFNWVVKKDGPFLLNRWRREQRVEDSKTGEVLARYVDFSTGNGNISGEPPIKFWLQNGHCIGGDHNQGMMYSFEHNLKGAEK